MVPSCEVSTRCLCRESLIEFTHCVTSSKKVCFKYYIYWGRRPGGIIIVLDRCSIWTSLIDLPQNLITTQRWKSIIIKISIYILCVLLAPSQTFIVCTCHWSMWVINMIILFVMVTYKLLKTLYSTCHCDPMWMMIIYLIVAYSVCWQANDNTKSLRWSL